LRLLGFSYGTLGLSYGTVGSSYGTVAFLYGTLAGRAFAGEDEFVARFGASARGAVVRGLDLVGGCLEEPAGEVGRLLR